jgi:phage shock protein A
MSDVGLAIQRAEDKTAQMQARAGAIDELMASGALDDVVSGPRDDIQAELDRMGAGTGVDSELARMKAELAQGSAPLELEGNQGVADGQPASAAQPVDQGQVGDAQ